MSDPYIHQYSFITVRHTWWHGVMCGSFFSLALWASALGHGFLALFFLLCSWTSGARYRQLKYD